jgi:hypothetical protein
VFEEEDLAQVEQEIAAGEARLTLLQMRIDDLRAHGHDTTDADTLFRAIEGVLEELRVYRRRMLLAFNRPLN